MIRTGALDQLHTDWMLLLSQKETRERSTGLRRERLVQSGPFLADPIN